MKPYLIDVPVLILFFNNPDRLKQVFEQVKLARPSALFLYQDGPRNERDLEGIHACREVVNDIDWECTVHRLYQPKNLGCDPSEYVSQKWAFSMVDKCVILEDDDVPAVTFFQFCKELLDKYEHDERVTMIAGLNHDEITEDCPNSYLFTRNISIWGWATWKRVVDRWDENYSFLDDEYASKKFEQMLKFDNLKKDMLLLAHKRRDKGVPYYESIHMCNMLMNSGLSIVPRKNMIVNIGFDNGVHSTGNISLHAKPIREIYMMDKHEMSFPLKHPKYVFEDVEYRKRVFKRMGWNAPMTMLYRRIVRRLKMLFR